MEEKVRKLAERTLGRFKTIPAEKRYMVSLAGIPGSGKTTLAKAIVASMNLQHTTEVAAYVPMDGYHLSRSQLNALPNPESANMRRGASFTFDAVGLQRLLRNLREPLTATSPLLQVPSFSHALRDPVPNAITIKPSHRIILIEGNYLALNCEPWRGMAKLYDERWFIEIDFESSMRRLVRRHMAAGLIENESEARLKIRQNDLINGRDIAERRIVIDELIPNIECPRYASIAGDT